MSEKTILENYYDELELAQTWKKEGRIFVDADVAGKELADGREFVPIDEYIEDFEKCIREMEAGADQELYNY